MRYKSKRFAKSLLSIIYTIQSQISPAVKFEDRNSMRRKYVCQRSYDLRVTDCYFYYLAYSIGSVLFVSIIPEIQTLFRTNDKNNTLLVIQMAAGSL